MNYYNDNVLIKIIDSHANNNKKKTNIIVL